MEGEFVLDMDSNPHPVMLAGAIAARAKWRGYLEAMCDATGKPAEEIEAWMDRKEEQHESL